MSLQPTSHFGCFPERRPPEGNLPLERFPQEMRSIPVVGRWVDRIRLPGHFDGGNTVCFAGLSRGACLSVKGGVRVFVLAVRGTARLESREGRFFLPPGRWMSLGMESCPSLTTQRNAIALVLLLPPGMESAVAPLFNAYGQSDVKQRRVALALWRQACRHDPIGTGGEDVLRRTFDLLEGLHAATRDRLPRCPGHTAERRQQFFSRLQHSLLVMQGHLERSLDLCALAACCSVSAWHFSKTFKAVYGVGPRAMAASMKLRLAADLLAHSDHPINAIATVSGFRSQSTLARAFRNHFGMNATEYRHVRRRALPTGHGARKRRKEEP